MEKQRLREHRGGDGKGYFASGWCWELPLGPSIALCVIHALFVGCTLLSKYQKYVPSLEKLSPLELYLSYSFNSSR
jgi:hypothetical protein